MLIRPQRDPDVRRKFICTNIEDDKNNNKLWQVEFWENERIAVYSWGRIKSDGSFAQSAIKQHNIYDVNKKIGDKVTHSDPSHRYKEIDLQRKDQKPDIKVLSSGVADDSGSNSDGNLIKPAQKSISISPQVSDLIKLVFSAANTKISQYLNANIDAISLNQIDRGRQLLVQARDLLAKKADQGLLSDVAIQYFNTIPTVLPLRVGKDKIVSDFYADLAEHDDRCNQLEAALATHKYTQTSTANTYDPIINDYMSLGIELEYISPTDDKYQQVHSFFNESIVSLKDGRLEGRIINAFQVKIPGERTAFNTWVDDHNKKNNNDQAANCNNLFHGTRRYNVRHILRTGLIIPKVAANGSRMGRGIYFAPRSERSLMYTDYSSERRSNKQPYLMFINQVALGKYKLYHNEAYNLQEAPAGFDSTYCDVSFGGRGGEYVVYRPEQQTIRSILMVEPL